MVASGRFAVSILAADQLEAAQYFSYPGRRFQYVAAEHLEVLTNGLPVVPHSIAWLACETFEVKPVADHHLFFARVTEVGTGRLKEPPLLYSSRHGWRVTGDKARVPGESVRDRLLARLAESGLALPTDLDDDDLP
jgi:flavin reductase (DIM6/NTAB) family NADH-FMN oxidoreductase RutF